jgi:hypothetical protein
MTSSFLSLAKEQYTRKGQVDPDVQVGLGTLYYMMGDYDDARDCWVAALGEKPNVSLVYLDLGMVPGWVELIQVECRTFYCGTGSEQLWQIVGIQKKLLMRIGGLWN